MDGRSPISCHILDTSVGKPARGVRVRLEGPLPDPSSAPASASPGATATSNGGAETAGSSSASSATVTSPSGTTSASALDAAPSAAAAASVKTFESQTDDDGRIKSWLPYSSARASGDVPTYTLEDVLSAHEGAALPGVSRTVWTLRFDVEGYFGRGNTFFPEVVVTFAVEKGQHYHVPLLLAPYSYSTYRGS